MKAVEGKKVCLCEFMQTPHLPPVRVHTHNPDCDLGVMKNLLQGLEMFWVCISSAIQYG